MTQMIQRILKWLDERAVKDAIYADYLRNNKMNWGA